MASQSSIANSSFIDDCISKNRTLQDCYEGLGLFSENGDARKDPVFPKEEANDLHRRIKEVAQSFKAAYRNDRDKLLADLIKEDALADQVQELGESYGHLLWGGPERCTTRYVGQVVNLDQLNWDDETDQKLIRFYLRCWITRVAVQSLPHKGKVKGKVRANTTIEHDNSDVEYSGADFVRTPPRAKDVSSSELPIRAPEVPSMLPPADRSRTERTTVQTGSIIASDATMVSDAGSRSPATPNKRKAPHLQGQESSGKLQKVTKEALASTISSQNRQRHVFSGSVSPGLNFPAFPIGQAQRRQRESTCDTDVTWAPPEMERVETEAVSDLNHVTGDTQEALSGAGLENDINGFDAHRSPTAGPSGTYRNPRRQDSVIPSPQHGTSNPQSTRTQSIFHTDMDIISTIKQRNSWHTTQVDVGSLDKWHLKQLRMELFKLLLSFLNGINQFGAETYEHDAEDRLNHLLVQLWINDADVIRSKLGNEFAEVKNVWEHWTNMRLLLAEFQHTTGYFGRPGNSWKEHLRQMERVDHAKASIAFIDMKRAVSNQGFASVIGPHFNNRLATLFDLLTQVEGCNGVEEFGALSSYNAELLEWFS
ncbi:hypothetical protein HBI23_006450 [Parastagonospora nodorum]|nr:hypothetical protein HBI23_006450 [Parastagonospora nodorum]